MSRMPMQDASPPTAVMDATPLPGDLDACHALILELARALTAAQSSREELSHELQAVQAYLQRLLKQIYGRRSERSLDPNQQAFDFGDNPEARDALAEAAAEAEQIIQEYTVRRAVRKQAAAPRQEKFPEHLPRVDVLVDAPEAQRQCPEHGDRRLIGYDVTETLKFERPKLWVQRTKYAKYACSSQPACGVTQAERPAGLVEGNRYDTSVAAEVITNKYAYHLTLYREQDQFAAAGWTPHRSTLLNLLIASVCLARPLVDYLRQIALESGGVGCDDTRVTLIVPPVVPDVDPANPRSQRIHDVLQDAIKAGRPSVLGRMWAYRSFELPVNVFDFTVSRHRDGPDEILADYSGLLMADCYSGFDGIELRCSESILRAACWAHARRKLIDIQMNYPQVASVLLAMIRELYDLEGRARMMTADERLALRQREALSVLARIRGYLESAPIQQALPKSDLAKAAGYLKNNWELLKGYTTDGRCPIDNNDTEQLMKQVAVGRKNWLFVGSVAGGERAATLMTLVSSAIRNALDVSAYIRDVLNQLLAGSTDYHALCPHVWKLSHPEAIRSYRIDERRDAADRKSVRRAVRRLRQS